MLSRLPLDHLTISYFNSSPAQISTYYINESLLPFHILSCKSFTSRGKIPQPLASMLRKYALVKSLKTMAQMLAMVMPLLHTLNDKICNCYGQYVGGMEVFAFGILRRLEKLLLKSKDLWDVEDFYKTARKVLDFGVNCGEKIYELCKTSEEEIPVKCLNSIAEATKEFRQDREQVLMWFPSET